MSGPVAISARIARPPDARWERLADAPRVACRARPYSTSFTLLAADALAIVFARSLAICGWQWLHPEVAPGSFLGFWPWLGFFAFTYAALDLYTPSRLGPVEELRRAVLGTVFVCLFLIAASFVLQDTARDLRGLLVVSGFLTAVLAPLLRAVARRLFARTPWWGVPVVVLGAGQTARLLIERLHKHPGLGFKPVACLDDDDGTRGDCAGVPVAGRLCMAPHLAKSLGIRHALVAIPSVGREELLWIMERWGSAFRHLILIPDLSGAASRWVAAPDLGGVLGLEVRQNLLLPLNRWTKRAIDIALSLLLGVIAVPVMTCAAALIRRGSPGSALFTQRREGERGKSLWIHKLRTMHPDAETMLGKVLATSSEIQSEWTCRCKLRKDPRVLPGIGRFLRKTSLDELPQLWNVLKGEMSLVGPRPFPLYHAEQFSPRFRALRRKVKPGLTGLWQVSDRTDDNFAAQEALDTYYIRNWSLWLDLYILARTVRAVLFP